MGQQRKLKQFRRELKQFRRKNQRTKASYFTEQYGVSPVAAEEPMLEDHNAELDQINEESEEIDEILKILIPVLPSFSGKNFKLWAIKMEGLLGSVDLWHYVQDGFVNSHDKRRGAIALYLIQFSTP
jgi:hypothetical protein